MVARSVVVVMPFGRKDKDKVEVKEDPKTKEDPETERRRSILNFKRLQYIVVNKCNVTPAMPADTTDRVVYAVKPAYTATQPISQEALNQIRAADIVIALVDEPNPNVIYEIARRRERGGPIVLVGDWPDIALYEQDFPRQNWKQDAVLQRIDLIAIDHGRKLPDFTVGIPQDLLEAIDTYDSELQKGIETALQEIEPSFLPHPQEAVEHMLGIVSEKTESFYPVSVVEFKFIGRGLIDNNDPPKVLDFDERFSSLYGYGGKTVAYADRPLTLPKLLGLLEDYVEPEDWAQFCADQRRLVNIISNAGYAKAKVPLRIKRKVANEAYQHTGKQYLPCVVAQVIDGKLDGPHSMYLLVEYIELPDSYT